MSLPTPIAPVSRTARRWLAGAALAVATAGCAQGTPAEGEPDLGVQLDRIDAAVVARDYAEARDGVDALVDAATDAESDGTITAEQADRIVAAAGVLLAELPGESTPTEPAPEPAPSPEPTAEPEPSEDSYDDESDDESEEKPGKPGKGKAHGHDKDEEDDD